ncbi:MAG: hypothetical protein H6713_02915 [Myxococcales bacterium]|nr:hypothetical protein [Myxococcales bacterium]
MPSRLSTTAQSPALALALGVSLVAVSASPRARAAEPAPAAGEGVESPPPRARKLFEEARDMLEKGRYDSAAQLFRKALVILDDPRVYLYGRAAVLSELYNAQIAAYNLDGDPIHLCELKDTLGDYTRALVDTYKDEAEQLPELKRAREHQDKITQLLVDHVASSDEYSSMAEICPERTLANGPAQDDPEPAPTTPLLNPDAPPPSAKPAPSVRSDPSPVEGPRADGPPAPGLALSGDEPRDPVPLFIAGGVTTTVGVGLLVTMTYAFVEMDRADQRVADIQYQAEVVDNRRPFTTAERAEIDQLQSKYDNLTRLAVTTAVFGGLAFGGGIAMLAIGKQQRDAARYRGLSLTPYGGRHGAGLQLHMRF